MTTFELHWAVLTLIVLISLLTGVCMAGAAMSQDEYND